MCTGCACRPDEEIRLLPPSFDGFMLLFLSIYSISKSSVSLLLRLVVLRTMVPLAGHCRHRFMVADDIGVDGSAHFPRSGLRPILLLDFAAPSTPMSSSAGSFGTQ
jgi:hypothetical protein